MREIARTKMGFFTTQNRIVRAAGKLLHLPANPAGHVTVLDAGCGTGKAIHELREIWLSRASNLNVSLLGIESDRHRYEQAAALFAIGKGGGAALWSAIEDYDRVRCTVANCRIPKSPVHPFRPGASRQP